MFNKTRSIARRYGAKVVAGSAGVLAVASGTNLSFLAVVKVAWLMPAQAQV